MYELNMEQEAVVAAPISHAVCVVAAAGTGKTTAITMRLARFIADGIQADSILALTFTNKAASELCARACAAIGAQAHAVHTHTFHSFCYGLLRQAPYAAVHPYGENFTVYDDARAREAVGHCVSEWWVQSNSGGGSAGAARARPLPPPPAGLKGRVHKLLRDRPQLLADTLSGRPTTGGIAGDGTLAMVATARTDTRALSPCHSTDPGGFLSCPGAAAASSPERAVAALYERHLVANKALDFSMAVLLVLRLWELHPSLLHAAQRRYRHGIVDEFQVPLLLLDHPFTYLLPRIVDEFQVRPTTDHRLLTRWPADR
jgi:hypothetical protein